VFDLGNGNYTVTFPWTGLVPGVFSLHIYVEFDRYEASTGCSTGHYMLGSTRQIRMARLDVIHVSLAWPRVDTQTDIRLSMKQVIVGSTATDVAGHDLSRYAGYWVLDSHAASVKPSRRWQDESYRRSTQVFPVNATRGLKWVMPFTAREHGDMSLEDLVRTFSGRWIHFIGKSMMGVTEATFAEVLNSVLNRDQTPKDVLGFVIPAHKWAPKGNDKHSECQGNSQSKTAFYFRHIDLIVTGLCHDVPESRAFDIDVHFTCLKSYWNASGIAGASRMTERLAAGPDVVVYNRGLHVVADLSNKTSIAKFHSEESRVMSVISSSLAPKRTQLILKSTPSTHFNMGRLPTSWMCRTTARIGCVNAISRSVAEAAPAEWQLADMHSLAVMRPDCQKDNRHNRCGNCRFAFVQTLFHMMADGMRPRV
jgi:hypothetical protein